MKNLNDFSSDQLRSLARLKQVGGEGIMKVLDEFILDGKDALVRADDMVRIHRLQGRVEAFEMFKQAVIEAANTDAGRNRI